MAAFFTRQIFSGILVCQYYGYQERGVMSIILCSTGAGTRYSSRGTDPHTILGYGHQLGVDLELLLDRSWIHDLEAVVALLRVSDLHFPVIHAQKEIGPALGSANPEEQAQALHWLDANCQLGGKLGARLVVLHLWGMPHSDAHLERNLRMWSACIDTAECHNLALAVETIPCRQSDPLSNVLRAVERDGRCRVALDTEFLAKHQQIETVFTTDWLWREPLVRHIHIKDYDGEGCSADGRRRYLQPGEGKINFERFFAGLSWCGFTGTISLEAPALSSDGLADVRRLQESIEVRLGSLEKSITKQFAIRGRHSISHFLYVEI